MNAPLVSVLTPTKNSARYLEACIAGLRAQREANLEIVVIDNYSTDGTLEIAQRIANSVVIASPERRSQLSAGARVAKGEYLSRVDGDFIVDPDVARTAIDACSYGYDAVCVDNVSSPNVSVWSRIRHFERLMYHGDDYHTAARFCTKAPSTRSVGSTSRSSPARTTIFTTAWSLPVSKSRASSPPSCIWASRKRCATSPQNHIITVSPCASSYGATGPAASRR